MNIDFLRTISVSLFIIGIVLLIIAVLLFIRWKVPFLIAEVSGANSRKEIARIQRDSEEKAYFWYAYDCKDCYSNDTNS